MSLLFTLRCCAAMSVCTLAACGGGGDSGGPGSGAETYPSSGTYGWILKAVGPTSALKYGLSLVHASRPDTEYIIESANAAVTDARLVSGGSVDPAQLRAASLLPRYLLYVVGGDVRSVPLAADGTAPATHVQRALSTSACQFVTDAIDYASVQNSRFIVSTAGADGRCGTADDGRAEVKLSVTLGVVVTPIVGETPFVVVRDPATLAPRGWLYSRSVGLWSGTPGTTFPTRPAMSPAVTAVVADTYNAVLVDDGARLAVQSFPGGLSVTETPLDAARTGGGGWALIGFDAGNFYVYRNAGTGFNSTYTVLKIARAAPVASVLATGTGLVSLTAMGKTVLYLTVFTAADNRLLRVDKLGGVPASASYPTTTFLSVQTSANGINQVWRVTGVGSTAAAYAIDIVDESGATLYTAPGGFPMSVVEATNRDFNSSESRTGFLFASGYSATRAFGDASLIGYDTATRTAVTLGALPGSAVFGSDFVFAHAIAGPGSRGLAFAARSNSGSVQETGAKVYSFDVNTANSLVATTVVR